jgi:hypothetical protein
MDLAADFESDRPLPVQLALVLEVCALREPVGAEQEHGIDEARLGAEVPP